MRYRERPMKTPKVSPRREVTIELDGKPYSGTYIVDRGSVRVSFGAGSKITQLGGSTAEHIAKLLLAELVNEQEQTDRPVAPDVRQAEQAAWSFIASQPPGREVSRSEVEQQLRRQGHSPGAIFEAWLRLKREGRTEPKS
jgi:hypothetical protein